MPLQLLLIFGICFSQIHKLKQLIMRYHEIHHFYIFGTQYQCKSSALLYYSLGDFKNINFHYVVVLISFSLINPFYATILFLYPMKTSEKLWFSDVSWGYRKRPKTWNGLRINNICWPAVISLIFKCAWCLIFKICS